MDIEEMKKYSQNKIEADNLTKQVRKKIKETIWEKQNLREGFSETFKPLISQFEKPDDPKAQNIFTQNQKMLQNQLALTEGIRANQKAITDGFNQFERLADMKELPQVENENENEIDPDLNPVRQKEILKYNLEKNLDEEDKQILVLLEYPQPNELLDKDPNEINEIYKIVKNDVKEMGYQIGALKRTKNKTEEQESELELNIMQQKTQKKYKEILDFYLRSLEYKVGQGLFFSPQELLHRFELLNGSLVAGNNGVLPEFIQIAHRLRDLGILNNKQLNKLLRKVIQTYYK